MQSKLQSFNLHKFLLVFFTFYILQQVVFKRLNDFLTLPQMDVLEKPQPNGVAASKIKEGTMIVTRTVGRKDRICSATPESTDSIRTYVHENCEKFSVENRFLQYFILIISYEPLTIL